MSKWAASQGSTCIDHRSPDPGHTLGVYSLTSLGDFPLDQFTRPHSVCQLNWTSIAILTPTAFRRRRRALFISLLPTATPPQYLLFARPTHP